MKNIAQKVLFLLLIIFSSCSSIRRFTVEVQEPAMITLPVSVKNVLIVNNAINQPINYGVERNFNNKSVRDDYPISLDSLVWVAVNEISNALGETDFFNKIAIYKEPIRSNNEWLTVSYLSPEQQREFYNLEDFNALLVIERLFFNLKQDVKTIKFGATSYDPTVFSEIRVDGVITCSMYTYTKETPLTTFSLQDSLFSKLILSNDSMVIFKHLPEYLLKDLSYNLGTGVATCFLPVWKPVDRFLFVGQNPRMQEAAGYAADHRWANAESIWIKQLENTNKPADKTKVAYNLAIANEMQDKFELALEWVAKAKGYFENANPDKYSREIELIDKYAIELGQRIQNNRLLDLQWGR